ncbi:MAG: beta-1,6-N-acetylglucosaminyltransferase, partial [Tolumonas sp.]|nr:beta-1,6-N-acetylglucosaminyltransferase [Tolumonas sp.]
MIAYLILVHRYPNQFKRLFKAIYHPSNHYMIHVDKRSGAELQTEISDFLAEYPNASMLKSEKALWGGYSLVDAELRGMNELLNMGLEWKFFITLSAQDFPLKSQTYIHNYLNQHIGKDFLKVANQAEIRPDTMHRLEEFVTETDNEIISEPVQKRA